MQKEQQKRPYLAPEITTVEFWVERGMEGSEVEVTPATLGVMQIGVINGMNLYMGDAMQNGSGYFSSGSSYSGGSGGGYFGYGDGTYF